MTRIIAHRGLLEGPDLGLENTKSNIEKALSMGFDVEIDIQHTESNGQIYIGHDRVKEECKFKNKEFYGLMEKYPNSIAWMHCKTLQSLSDLLMNYDLPSNCEIFAHDKDFASITYPLGCVWSYPQKYVGLVNLSYYIDVLPETWGPPSSFKDRYGSKIDPSWFDDKPYKFEPYGICTDYPIILKRTIKSINGEE